MDVRAKTTNEKTPVFFATDDAGAGLVAPMSPKGFGGGVPPPPVVGDGNVGWGWPTAGDGAGKVGCEAEAVGDVF